MPQDPVLKVVFSVAKAAGKRFVALVLDAIQCMFFCAYVN
jgi:hypothetical protein